MQAKWCLSDRDHSFGGLSRMAALAVALVSASLAPVGRGDEKDPGAGKGAVSAAGSVAAPGRGVTGSAGAADPKELPTAAETSAPRNKREIYQQTLKGTVWIINPVASGSMMGTGSLVDAKRKLVLTNHHVVEGYQGPVMVFFPVEKDGALVTDPNYYRKKVPPISGRVVDSQSGVDLALVELESVPDGSREIQLAEKSAMPGEEVHSVAGLPQGSTGLWIFTTGAVRQVYRRQAVLDKQLVDAMVMETQLPINRGNSGGPVVNDSGELAGVVSWGQEEAKLVQCSIDVSEARKYLNETRPLVHPETAEAFAKRGRRHLEEQRLDQAIEDMNSAIQLDPSLALAYVARGNAFVGKGDITSAMGDFDEAIRLEPQSSEAYLGRGIARRRQGKLDESVADLTEAIRKVPREVQLYDAFNERAISHFWKEEYTAAVEDLDRAIALLDRVEKDADRVTTRLMRDKAQLYANRGESRQRMGEHEKALADFDVAVEQNKSNPEFFALCGQSFLALGRHNDALAVYDAAIRLDGKRAASFRGRGQTYQAMNRLQDAIKDYLAASDLDTTDGEPINDAGCCLYRLGEYQLAANAFDLAIQRNGQTAQYHSNRGDSYVELKNFAEALKSYDAAVQLASDNVGFLWSRGKAYEGAGDIEAAARDYRRAAELDPAGHKHHDRRYLTLVNESGEPLRVELRYHTKGVDGNWRWYPDGTDVVVYTLNPGQRASLYHGEFRVAADRVRISAKGNNTGRVWNTYLDTDYIIAPACGYLSTQPTYEEFTHTFTN